MKGQMVFEFVIASLILFSIIFYTLSFLASDFGMRHGSFVSDRLESNAIRVSNILLGTHENGIVGDWPVLDQASIDAFGTKCNDEYRPLQNSLGLREESPYVTYMHFNITVADKTKTYLNCGREPPAGVGMGSVTRYALSPPPEEIVRIDVTVW
jgi:hypothetical protein